MSQKPHTFVQFSHLALSSQTTLCNVAVSFFKEFPRVCLKGLQARGGSVHLQGAWLLFGILFYLFSLFSEGMSSRGEGADRAKMRDRDERRRWGEKEYKRMKRTWEERKVCVCGGGGQREEEDVWKTGSSGRIAGKAPVTEEAPAFYHRLLPSFFHPSLLSGNRRDTQRGKSGCLRFLLPSCDHLLS